MRNRFAPRGLALLRFQSIRHSTRCNHPSSTRGTVSASADPALVVADQHAAGKPPLGVLAVGLDHPASSMDRSKGGRAGVEPAYPCTPLRKSSVHRVLIGACFRNGRQDVFQSNDRRSCESESLRCSAIATALLRRFALRLPVGSETPVGVEPTWTALAAGCRAVWLQRHGARSVERATFHCSSLKVVVAVDAIKSGLTSGNTS
jgi:hypothetical protein